MLDNWERWEKEKPAWFNGMFKASVEDDMIPKKALAKLGGGSRRRSSVGEQLGMSSGGGAAASPAQVVPVNE